MTIRQYIEKAKEKAKTALGIGVSLIAGLSGTASAQDPAEIAKQQFIHPRITAESTIQEDSRKIDTIFGVSKEGNEYNEDFRVKTHYTELNGEEKNSLAAAFRTPKFNLGNTTNRAFIMTEFGDRREGVGIETRHDLGSLNFNLQAETAPQENASHLGAGATYDFGKISLGAGFDEYKIGEDTTDSSLVNAILKPNANNHLGVGLQTIHKDDSTAYNLNTYWLNFGKDKEWGARLITNYSFGENQDSTLRGEWILAQHPSFSPTSGFFIVGRSMADGDLLGKGLLEQTLCTPRTPLPNRSRKGERGFVALISGSVTDTNKGNKGYARTEVGYGVPTSRGDIIPTLIYQDNFSPEAHKHNGGAGVIFSYKGLRLESNATTDGKDTTAFIGLQQQF